jgi:hypothetical protein
MQPILFEKKIGPSAGETDEIFAQWLFWITRDVVLDARPVEEKHPGTQRTFSTIERELAFPTVYKFKEKPWETRAINAVVGAATLESTAPDLEIGHFCIIRILRIIEEKHP